MLQQIIALILIIFFILRLIWQKQTNKINSREFALWFIFWFLVAGAVISIKKIDKLVADLGFSSSGINVLLYFSVLLLFYLIFKMRLKIEKINKNISKINSHIAIQNAQEKKQSQN